MPRFLVGDEQGQIKSLEYFPSPVADGTKYKLTPLSRRATGEQKISVQKMAITQNIGGSKAVVTGYSDGIVTVSTYQGEDEKLDVKLEWKDSRLKNGAASIGLASRDNKIYTCSTNGALQLTSIPDFTTDSDPAPIHQQTSLPTRLHDWKLSSDAMSFAYGGDEVELSVWNTEDAFHPRTENLNLSAAASKKRKRNNELFPGEIWRAKNVANDTLGLRQPIRITSLDYLSTNSLVTGTQLGDVRRYDTRVARRPVSDWKGLAKVGGIQTVAKGLSDHELFISDHGTNLLSIDLRNGRVLYGYKGLSGAVTSVAPSPGILASVANDRYARLHSSFPPPAKEGQNLDHKGAILEKVYVTSTPTVIVWDDTLDRENKAPSTSDEQEDQIWREMEQVEETGTEETQGKSKRRHFSG